MYKLNRIEDTDIFFLSKATVKLLGENLITGTFNEVFAVASTLRDNALDLGTGSSIKVNLAAEMTNIIDAKWYVIFLDVNPSTLFIQIVRTSGAEKYSLPTNFVTAYQEPLADIFTRISNLVN